MSSVDDLDYRCHAFDLDHTIVNNNTSHAFCRFLCERGILPKRALFESLAAQFQLKGLGRSLKEIHQILFVRVLKGLECSQLEAVVDEFLDQFFLTSIYPPAYGVFKRQQHVGGTMLLMSSSPAFLVEKVAKRLGADHWSATEYVTDELGRLQSVKSFLDGEAKAEEIFRFSLEKGFTLSLCKAYSDSYHDLPFLLAAGRAVAVNPDRKLYRFARRRDWEIM